MKQIVIFLIMMSCAFCAASQENLLSFKSNRSDETVYPYRENCCSVCIRPCVGDDGCRRSKSNRCVQIGCCVVTGAVVLTATFIWFMQYHREKRS